MSDALVAAFWFLVTLISGLAEGLAMALTLCVLLNFAVLILSIVVGAFVDFFSDDTQGESR
jgi:hypothetical protein